MDGNQFLEIVERDAQVIAAMKSALEAMALTHGTKIQSVGVSGVLDYGKQILGLMDALELLGADIDSLPTGEKKRTRIR